MRVSEAKIIAGLFGWKRGAASIFASGFIRALREEIEDRYRHTTMYRAWTMGQLLGSICEEIANDKLVVTSEYLRAFERVIRNCEK